MRSIKPNLDVVLVIQRKVGKCGQDRPHQGGSSLLVLPVRNGYDELQQQGDDVEVMQLGKDVLILPSSQSLEQYQQSTFHVLGLGSSHEADEFLIALKLLEQP
jgi:virulence-associated protein VagC